MKTLNQTGMNPKLANEVLAHLGVEVGNAGGISLLDGLVAAYTRRVPWESVSRIAKKADALSEQGITKGQDLARWPAEFWRSAIVSGTGGTCFESNYAFLALLEELGYSGYLTVNNMEQSIGCHSAIVLFVDENRWLVDVGLPLYTPIPLDLAGVTSRESTFHLYQARPDGTGVYTIERSHHPQAYCFALIDTAVPEPAYRRVLAADYGPNGLFLDRAIVSKVIEGHVCRFNSGESPYMLERFRRAYVDRHALADEPAKEIALTFDLDEQLVKRALKTVEPTD